MSLESLSNELLIDLFEFFNVIDLLHAFHGLNTRFDSLLFKYFRNYRVDLRSIFKEDFNFFCRTYLPSIINQIIYLRLSDDEDTPYQCSHFLSNGFTIGRFDKLRSLTFNCINSDPKINQHSFSDLYLLHHLTHLKFIDCQLFHIDGDEFQNVIDQIWNLPKLIYLYWDFNFKGTKYFCIPTIVSTSLQYLTIRKSYWCSYQFNDIMEKTPCLRKFTLSLDSYEEDHRLPVHEFKPTYLNLLVESLVLFVEQNSQCTMINLLQLLPNISHLKVELLYIKMDGHRWEQIIVKYLPKLKILHFKMNIHLSLSTNDQNNEEKVDQYIGTYRTPFWIEQHQWFIRCHWGRWMDNLIIRVHTLPYKFDDFPLLYDDLNYKTKSTCPHDMHFSYDSVRRLPYAPSMFNDQILSHIQLNNIEKLWLSSPIDHCFLSIVTKFEKLRFLGVSIPTNKYQLQLQTLLDSAPRLYSLSFESWNTSNMPPYQCISKSIRQLILQGHDQSRRRIYYDRHKCMELSQSPLGTQCRILDINIELEEVIGIMILINSMTNLRTLHVFYENDQNKKKYVEMLQKYLSSTWTVTHRYGQITLQS